MEHVPVLLQEVLEYLNPQPGQNMVDATFGRGGHARAILERLRPGGRLLVIDRDPKAIAEAQSLGEGVASHVGNFSSIEEITHYVLPDLRIHGVLLDCGISSAQLADASLGLSFIQAGPLDMRLDRQGAMTAATIVNSWSENELADVIYQLGEERSSRRIASAIVTARRKEKITTTTQLATIVEGVLRRRGRIHPATKTFQALRMAVNEELEHLRKGLSGALRVLSQGGRAAIISFHSLEDRLVKQTLRAAAREEGSSYRLLTKHAIVPTRNEILQNPRARSAKLRVIERL